MRTCSFGCMFVGTDPHTSNIARLHQGAQCRASIGKWVQGADTHALEHRLGILASEEKLLERVCDAVLTHVRDSQQWELGQYGTSSPCLMIP